MFANGKRVFRLTFDLANKLYYIVFSIVLMIVMIVMIVMSVMIVMIAMIAMIVMIVIRRLCCVVRTWVHL